MNWDRYLAQEGVKASVSQERRGFYVSLLDRSHSSLWSAGFRWGVYKKGRIYLAFRKLEDAKKAKKRLEYE